MEQHRTFCRICPVLCGLVVTTEDDRVVEVRGDAEHPISRGYTCPKGRAAGALHHHPLRLDEPRLRDAVASWDVVLGDLASSLQRIVGEHGPDAVAVYYGTWSWMDAFGRARLDTLLRHLGTRSRYSAITVDAIARLTVADLMAGNPGLLPSLDLDDPGLTVLVGTNPVVSHGHAGAIVDPVRALRRVAAGPGLWVVDPRRTETARLATRHLAVRPGGDAALLAGVLHGLFERGADHGYLAEHARNVDALRAAVAPWTVERAAAASGLEVAELEALTDAIRRAGRVAVVTGTGTTMAPDALVVEWLAWSIQVVTGSFEAPGGTWFNPGGIARADLTSKPSRPSIPQPGPASRSDLQSRFGEMPCAALADEIDSGNVRALLVVGGDPLTALPDTTRLERAFDRLDVLAVFDVLENDTVRRASHVLACAGMLERDDTTLFTDRFASVVSAQRTDPVVTRGASRRLLVDIADDLGARLGLELDPDRWARVLKRAPQLDTPGVVLGEPARPRGWVHERVLPDGRWDVAPEPLVERFAVLPLARTPATLVAIPRRVMRRMNSVLRDVGGGGDDRSLWVHPLDAGTAATGDRAVLRSATGAIEVELRVTDDVVVGAVSVPHGLGDQNVNRLTTGAPGGVDPLSGMTTQSGFAVTLEPVGPSR